MRERAIQSKLPSAAGDGALIQSVLAGDREAFYTLVSPYQGAAFRAAYVLLQNHGDAEEVVQEGFLKAYRHLSTFRAEAKFSTWLLQIVVNEARLRLRHARVAKEEPLDEAMETEEGFMPRELGAWTDTPEEKYAAEEIQQLVRKTIATLPPMYRAVLVIRDMEGLSTNEVAEALSVSVPNVKTRLARARLMLRERLSPHFQKSWLERLRWRGKGGMP